MKLPAMDFITEDQKRKMAKEIADNALDQYEYNGKTLRQWADLISQEGHIPHGTWEDPYMNIRCSNCGAEFDAEIVFMLNGGDGDYYPDYCPACGARMDDEIDHRYLINAAREINAMCKRIESCSNCPFFLLEGDVPCALSDDEFTCTPYNWIMTGGEVWRL